MFSTIPLPGLYQHLYLKVFITSSLPMLPSFIFLVKDQFKRATQYLCHSESSVVSLVFSFISLATSLPKLLPPQPIFIPSNLSGGGESFYSLCCCPYLSLTSLRKSLCIHFFFWLFLILSLFPQWAFFFFPPLDLSKALCQAAPCIFYSRHPEPLWLNCDLKTLCLCL